MENLKKLPKIIRHCMTIGELPTSYKISMTYEEQLLWFCHFLENEVIPVVNNNSQVVEELKNYVEHYFDNLDVQEEINNKLDEMAENGELEEIITSYLQLNGVLIFNTVADMIASESLIEGSTCRTLGQINYNDGKGRFYKIEKIISGVADGFNLISLGRDDLYARLIKEDDIYINVTKYGIKNDGTNITTTLQALINSFDEGVTFFFPNGTYYFEGIELKSNTRIKGNTNTNFIVNNDEIIKQFIIDDKENIKIENCNFQNGTTYERELVGGATRNQKASIFMNEATNIEIKNCKFNINSGVAFIYGINTEYVIIENCKFNGTNYSFIEQISNCKHWYINNNSFENIFTTSTGNAYAIASGVLNYTTDSGFTEDIHITNNTFKNHLNWECVESHGGRDYYIENNQFYECYQPIAIFDDNRIARTFDMRNINIINNFIECLNSDNSFISYAITVRGNNGTGKLCKKVTISNNTILSPNYNAVIGFNCREIDDLILTNNYTYGIKAPVFTGQYILNGKIENNTFENTPFSAQPTSRTRDFYCEYMYNISIQGNTNISLWQPNYVLDMIGTCYIKNYEKNNWYYVSNVVQTIGKLYRYGKLGDLRIQQSILYPNARATNKYLQSISATNVMTFKTTNGSNIVETSVNALDKLSIGENVKLVGAGQNNEDIEAIFMEYIDSTHIKLNINMYHDANNVQVDTLDAIWTNLPVST